MMTGAPMSPGSPSFPSWLTLELIYRMAMDGKRVSVRFIRTDLRVRQPRHASSCFVATRATFGVGSNTSSCKSKD